MTNEITTNLHRSMLPIVNVNSPAMNRRERKNCATCNYLIVITDNSQRLEGGSAGMA